MVLADGEKLPERASQCTQTADSKEDEVGSSLSSGLSYLLTLRSAHPAWGRGVGYIPGGSGNR